MPFVVDKPIRFHHCDPAGIVFYPQYFVLMNELVEDWFDQGLGVDFGGYHARDRLGVPMARIECEFAAPSGVGDRLAFALVVERLGNASITLRVSATCAGEERVRARLVLVQASLETRRAVPLSDDLRARMARYVAAG
ncbi:MAG TPA: thioesterase family protein [Kofleriaceae bacterium]|jgi:4-hydroxybenzoyl-CoA thioesterase|nr:thioesterase family protein [Casimicrobiaceae bacterium]HVK84799.1 thioesterase family protein [Kofleriaceae bacterium]